MVCTLYKDGFLLKTSLKYPGWTPGSLLIMIGRTLRSSVEYPGGGGGGGGDILPLGGTVCPSAECPGGLRTNLTVTADNPVGKA